MSFSNNFLSNIFTNELCALFNKNINNDLIPAVDDVYDLGSANRRWRDLNIDDIKSSGSPSASLNSLGSFLIGGGVWSPVPLNNGFSIKFNLNVAKTILTYTGTRKFIRFSCNAQFLRNATNNTHCAISLVLNGNPIMTQTCLVNTASAIVPVSLNHVFVVLPNDTLQLQVNCETGTALLNEYTFLGRTSPAITVNINEVLGV
jgi:hypothetical protein